jgi:hypothetical protein
MILGRQAYAATKKSDDTDYSVETAMRDAPPLYTAAPPPDEPVAYDTTPNNSSWYERPLQQSTAHVVNHIVENMMYKALAR